MIALRADRARRGHAGVVGLGAFSCVTWASRAQGGRSSSRGAAPDTRSRRRRSRRTSGPNLDDASAGVGPGCLGSPRSSTSSAAGSPHRRDQAQGPFARGRSESRHAWLHRDALGMTANLATRRRPGSVSRRPSAMRAAGSLTRAASSATATRCTRTTTRSGRSRPRGQDLGRPRAARPARARRGRDRRRRALTCQVTHVVVASAPADDAALQPVRATLGMRRDHDLVGCERSDRIGDRLDRIGRRRPRRGPSSRGRDRLERLLEAAACRRPRCAVLVRDPVADRRVERRRDVRAPRLSRPRSRRSSSARSSEPATVSFAITNSLFPPGGCAGGHLLLGARDRSPPSSPQPTAMPARATKRRDRRTVRDESIAISRNTRSCPSGNPNCLRSVETGSSCRGCSRHRPAPAGARARLRESPRAA